MAILPDLASDPTTDAHDAVPLKTQAVRGGAVVMVAQSARYALRFVSGIILARLLVPEDFGLIAMVGAVAGFVMLFRDLGLSTATVQRSHIDHTDLSTLHWINVGVSIALGGTLALLSAPIVWFFGEPRLSAITLCFATGVPLAGMAVQHNALLRREMRFTTLAAIEVVAALASIVAALALALLGAGYWSLVAMPLIDTLVSTILTRRASAWRPGWPALGGNVRSMLRFGGHLTGFNVLNYFARTFDNLLIGRYWGPAQLGLYSKAYGLLLLPISQIVAPISAVALPTLSRLQSDPARFRKYYCHALSLLSFMTLPLATFLTLTAPDFVSVLLGPKWADTSTIFRLLSVSAAVQPVLSTMGWLYTALGRGVEMLKWGAASSLLIVLAFCVGLPYGAEGVALSYSLVILLLAVPCVLYATRGTPVSVRDITKALAGPVGACLLAGAGTALFLSFAAERLPALLRLLFSGCVMAGVYAFVVLVLLDERRLFSEIWLSLRSMHTDPAEPRQTKSVTGS